MIATTNSLKINVATIPEEGLNFVFSEGGAWFRACFGEIADLDFEVEKVDVRCLITKASGTVFIQGEIRATIDMRCSRCLDSMHYPFSADFSYTLTPGNPVFAEDEIELQAEDLETSYFQGDFIDLTPMICEQIILQIPMKVLCREDCKGLCPQCGANLNDELCTCPRGCIDSRMAVLKNFKINN